MSNQSKKWIGTLNNYTEEENTDLIRMMLSPRVEYAIIGREVGEQGTPHLQMFWLFKTNRRFSAMQAMNNRTRWFPANGTKESNRKYCSKEGNFAEHGSIGKERGQQANENRVEMWDSYYKACVENDLESIPSEILIKYYTTLKKIASDNRVKPVDLMKTCGLWIHGAPGTGKSHAARQLCVKQPIYMKQINKWWCDYSDQDNIIIDDWDPSHAGFLHLLKQWTDKYSFRAEFKGGNFFIRPKRVIVTSNHSIEECFPDANHYDLSAIKRRFDVIEWTIDMRKPDQPEGRSAANAADQAAADRIDGVPERYINDIDDDEDDE